MEERQELRFYSSKDLEPIGRNQFRGAKEGRRKASKRGSGRNVSKFYTVQNTTVPRSHQESILPKEKSSDNKNSPSAATNLDLGEIIGKPNLPLPTLSADMSQKQQSA